MKANCPIVGCPNKREAEHLFCRSCWAAIPGKRQRGIVAAFRKGDRETYKRLVREAYRFLKKGQETE